MFWASIGHGDGNTAEAGAAAGSVDRDERCGPDSWECLLRPTKSDSGWAQVRCQGGAALPEVLQEEPVWPAEHGAGSVLPVSPDRLLRRPGFGARDRVADGGLAVTTQVSGLRAGRGHAGPFHDFAHATSVLVGDTQGRIPLGAEDSSGRGVDQRADRL